MLFSESIVNIVLFLLPVVTFITPLRRNIKSNLPAIRRFNGVSRVFGGRGVFFWDLTKRVAGFAITTFIALVPENIKPNLWRFWVDREGKISGY